MRCRNCHTQLMPTDTHCPSCHSSIARATAAAPGEMAKNSDNALLNVLPMFGGAAGGLLAGAIKAAQTSTQPTPSRRYHGPEAMGAPAPATSGGSKILKLLIGLVFLLGGGLLVFIAGQEAWNARAVAQRQATEVTAAELGRTDFAGSAPDWIHYTFTESKPTAVAVKRNRASGGGEAEARCLLVRVEDKWLLATVPPGFQGNDLTGYLVPFDPTESRPVLEQVAKAEPKVKGLLPFEFNGVEGSASDQHLRHTAAALLGCLGLVGVLIGVYFIPFGSSAAAVHLGAVQPAAVDNPRPRQ